MIHLDIPQGEGQWHFERLGIPTSSAFHRILTPSLKPAAGATTYLYELLAAWFVGEPQDNEGNAWTHRGTEMEREARAWYEFENSVTIEPVGFCLTDDRRVGSSPDGKIGGQEAGIEIKCPAAKVHIATILGENAHKHRSQVQGQLLVTGWDYVDLVVYSPLLPPTVTRHEPDEEWREAFVPALEAFLERLESARARVAEVTGRKGKA